MEYSVFVFVLTIFSTIVSAAFIGVNGLSIKKTIVNIPLYLLEESVYLFDNEGDFDPYFDLDLVKYNVSNYINNNLKNKCNSYLISYYPFKYKNEEIIIDESNYVKNIQIHFKCTYYEDFNVEVASKYSITSIGVNKDE